MHSLASHNPCTKLYDSLSAGHKTQEPNLSLHTIRVKLAQHVFHVPMCFVCMQLLSHRSQVATAAVRGKVGYALLPGSESVYNRQTKKLIPCDPVMCPYATR